MLWQVDHEVILTTHSGRPPVRVCRIVVSSPSSVGGDVVFWMLLRKVFCHFDHEVILTTHSGRPPCVWVESWLVPPLA